MNEENEVTEDLLRPKKEEKNLQRPKTPKKPSKIGSAIIFIVLTGVIVLICLFANSMCNQGQDTANTERKVRGESRDGNFNVNLTHYLTQAEPYAGGQIAANGSETFGISGQNTLSDSSSKSVVQFEDAQEADTGLSYDEDGNSIPSLNLYGEDIYYNQDNSIFRMKKDGSGQRVICKKIDGLRPRIFHVYDGKIYAFFSDDNYAYAGAEQAPVCALYAMDLDGKNAEKLTDDICNTTFSLDQDTIYYIAADYDDEGNPTSIEIKRMDLDGSHAYTILDLTDSKYENANDFYVQKGQLYYNAGTQEGVYNVKTGETNMIDTPDSGTVLQYVADTEQDQNYLLTRAGEDDSGDEQYCVWRTNSDGSGAALIYRKRAADLPPTLYQGSNGVYLLDCADNGDDVVYFAGSKDKKMQQIEM